MSLELKSVAVRNKSTIRIRRDAKVPISKPCPTTEVINDLEDKEAIRVTKVSNPPETRTKLRGKTN